MAGGRWRLDLRRPWRLGQYVLSTPPRPELLIDAVHEARDILERERASRVSPQIVLAFDAASVRLSVVIAELRAARERERLSPDTARYVAQYLAAVDRELGHVLVSAFEPPPGDDLLLDYRNRLVDHGHSPRTRRNRLCVVMQVLRLARKTGRLRASPEKPPATVGGEVMSIPRWQWYTEHDFRHLRDNVGSFVDGPGRANRPRSARWNDYVARRRLYLSIAYYTGMHTRDVDGVTDEFLSVDVGAFLRRNTKSAACVPEAMLTMPEQLRLDCLAELARLGRPWRAGELPAGGPWPSVARVLQRAAARLGLPPVNMRILRRSCVRELALRGWSERDCAEYLGHADHTMIRTVYLRVPVMTRSPVMVPWTVAGIRTATGTVTPLRAGHRAAPLHLLVDSDGNPGRVPKPSRDELRRAKPASAHAADGCASGVGSGLKLTVDSHKTAKGGP
ncbi:MAG: hypothetical protein PHR30_18440 [Gallionellaceae bacterium]|nr:hypothetical protein [Gallionellaceae bacterium]